MHYHCPKPFFRKSRGTWYLQLDGKQVSLGKDRAEAFRRYHELMAATPLDRTRRLESDHGLRLTELFDRFLSWVEKRHAPATYQWYHYRLQRFAERYPDLTVQQLRPYHVQEWVDTYATHRPTTTRNYMRTIKRCMQWARSLGYIDSNPLEYLTMPAADSREVAITPEQFEQILTHVHCPCLRDLMVVTYETGCRPQESLRLEIRHVDLENQRWVFPREEAKGKKVPRIVYLTGKAAEITRRLIAGRKSGHVFRNSRGNPWTSDAANCAIQRVRDRLGREEMIRRGIRVSDKEIKEFSRTLSQTKRVGRKIVRKNPGDLRYEAKSKLRDRMARKYSPELSLYALRHSWATNALQRGVDSLTVAILMGHRDPSMLAKVYQHLSHNPKHMLAEARRAGASAE